jgi:hypothetical protein
VDWNAGGSRAVKNLTQRRKAAETQKNSRTIFFKTFAPPHFCAFALISDGSKFAVKLSLPGGAVR